MILKTLHFFSGKGRGKKAKSLLRKLTNGVFFSKVKRWKSEIELHIRRRMCVYVLTLENYIKMKSLPMRIAPLIVGARLLRPKRWRMFEAVILVFESLRRNVNFKLSRKAVRALYCPSRDSLNFSYYNANKTAHEKENSFRSHFLRKNFQPTCVLSGNFLLESIWLCVAFQVEINCDKQTFLAEKKGGLSL